MDESGMFIASGNDRPRPTVLVVDDEPYIAESISALLAEYGYRVATALNGNEAVTALKAEKIDIVLSDVKMPGVSGIELLLRIRGINPDVPVILMTAYPELGITVDAIKKGAFDFIIKPYKYEHLLHSIGKAAEHIRLMQLERNYMAILENTVMEKTQELREALALLKDTNREIIQRLISVAEFRDTDTGAHIARIGFYSKLIADDLGMQSDFIETLSFAAPMHDIGKIGIPDSILLKPGRLTPEEFDVMKTHTSIGEKMLSASEYPNIKLASSIALTHHERWDGSGYPLGLRGQDIPLEGRIVIICDQYDALMSKRPYKKSFTHQEAVEIITKGDGRTLPGHFDPDVLNAFVKTASSFEEFFNAHQD